MITGSAAFNASVAAVRSPPEIASSTLRTELRSRERRDLLITVRRAILRVALRADVVLAIRISFQHWRAEPWPRARANRAGRGKWVRRRSESTAKAAGYRETPSGRQRPPGSSFLIRSSP